MIGQKNKPFVGLRVVIPNPAKRLGIALDLIISGLSDDLIASQTDGFVDGLRVQPLIVEIAFGPCYKDGLVLMNPVEMGEIEVSAIHHIDRIRLGNHVIEDIDIAYFPVGDLDKYRDISLLCNDRGTGSHIFETHGVEEIPSTQKRRFGLDSLVISHPFRDWK